MRTFLKLILIGMLVLTACSSENHGIEVGNPNISGKKTLVDPQSGNEKYAVEFTDGDSAVVTQIQKSPVDVLDVKQSIVTFSQGNPVVEAQFVNATRVRILLQFSANGSLIGGELFVNGKATVATFSEDVSQVQSQQVVAGNQALGDRDLPQAERAFCDELVNHPRDSHLAFGCFLSKLLMVGNTPESASLLAAFGAPAFDSRVSLLGDNGLFARKDEIVRGTSRLPSFNYTHFAFLPFANFFTVNRALNTENKITRFVQLAITKGITAAELRRRITALTNHFIAMEGLLAIVLADPQFSYLIPADLFRTSGDVKVSYNDARLFMAGVKYSIVGFNLVAAYDPGVVIEKSIRNGRLNKAYFVADLNGAGGNVGGVAVDNISFMTLLDRNRVINSRARYLDGTVLGKGAMELIGRGVGSYFFGVSEGPQNVEQIVDFLGDCIQSVNNGMTEINLPTRNPHSIRANLRDFFITPPDAAAVDVEAGDPFVLEDGEVKPVESYFDILFEGIVEF